MGFSDLSLFVLLPPASPPVSSPAHKGAGVQPGSHSHTQAAIHKWERVCTCVCCRVAPKVMSPKDLKTDLPLFR